MLMSIVNRTMDQSEKRPGLLAFTRRAPSIVAKTESEFHRHSESPFGQLLSPCTIA